MSSVAPSGVNQISLNNIQGMDLETAMLSVQTNRANLLEGQLKSQIEGVQAKNESISKLNEALGQLNKIAALFGGSAKATDTAVGTSMKNGDYQMEKEANTALQAAGLKVFDGAGGRDLTGSFVANSVNGNSTKGQIDGAIQQIKSAIDSASNSQQMDMLRLQSLSNKRNEAFETMTNFIKKMQDSRNSIIGNMR